jgi:hypothetical protein
LIEIFLEGAATRDFGELGAEQPQPELLEEPE